MRFVVRQAGSGFCHMDQAPTPALLPFPLIEREREKERERERKRREIEREREREKEKERERGRDREREREILCQVTQREVSWVKETGLPLGGRRRSWDGGVSMQAYTNAYLWKRAARTALTGGDFI
jgi:hypothetical protein